MAVREAEVSFAAWIAVGTLLFACSGDDASEPDAGAGSGGAGLAGNTAAPAGSSMWPTAGSLAGASGTLSPAGAGAVDAGAVDGGDAAVIDPVPPPSLIGDVTYSTPSQAFEGSLEVALATEIAGAEIRYTTDGTLPVASSTLYAGTQLTLTETTQLRAQAFVAGAPSGNVSTAIYIARDFDAVSDLPILILDGYGAGASEDRDVYLDAAFMLFEPVEGQATLSALPTVATRAGYHLRGQSSSRFPQRPYRIELWDNANEDADYPIAGMPAEADWALIAPYYDRTLIRNPFIYTLGRDIGLEAPRTAFVEVYMRFEPGPVQASDYQGIYWLTETIKNASARTNLKQLRETDTELPAISGGYIFKFDQAAAEEPELVCEGSPPLPSGFGGMGMMGGFGMMGGGGSGTCFVDLEVVDPDPLNDPQRLWLTDYIQTFHDALHAEPIGDYAQHIDVASFVDYLIVNELSRNVDAYVRSAYFHKDRDGKLRGGPLWDYNFALAVGGQNTTDPRGGFQYDGSRNVSNWFPKLTEDEAFMSQTRARWQALRTSVLSDAALAQRMDMLTAPIARAVERDYARWPVSEIYENPGIVRGPTVETWQEQLAAMRQWLFDRAAWIDEQYQ